MGKIIKDFRDNFTIIHNDIIKDERLHLKTLGLFMYLWHQPSDWNFYFSEVIKHHIDGKDATRSALNELERYGYLTRARDRNKKGQFADSDWILTDQPSPSIDNSSNEPKSENPTLDSATSENKQLLSTNVTKDQLKNNATTTADTQNSNYELKDKFTDVLTFYQQNIGVLNPITTEDIVYWCNDLSPEVVTEAIRRTAQSNKNWRYTTGILRDWVKHNIKTLDQIKASDVEFQRKNEAKYGKRKNNKPAPQYKAGDDAYRKMAQNEAEGKLPWED